MKGTSKQTEKVKPSKRSAVAASPQSMELPDNLWERISRKACELWQERGYRDGQDLEDWFDARTIVMEESHEARE
ncbi:MAG: DUF2934 domain-containing protein [Nitrospirota bacterium]|nr:DUF2934 domain-containing protein [Nitrospirota bacterium]MDP3596488.1 DUF2934 domain-containing protein [Nitrospirota bacterium]